jgi:hypothetical protein
MKRETAKFRPVGRSSPSLFIDRHGISDAVEIVKTRILRHLVLVASTLQLQAAELEILNDGTARPAAVVVVEDFPNLLSGEFKRNDGTVIPYQTHSERKLVLVTGPLKSNEILRLKATRSPGTPAPDPLLPRLADDRFELKAGNRVIANYQTTARNSPRENLDPEFLRGGYLHPIFSPSGKIVTDDYALNHLHHHGVWTAWTKTSFDGREPDFWNMGQGKGKVDFSSLISYWHGSVQSGFSSHLKHTDLTSGSPVNVLDEIWNVRAYSAGNDFNIIDLESAQTCATDKPLILPVFHYGGIGIRGREEWNGKENASFITSEKITDRNKANSEPARWIAMSGRIGDGVAGIAILCHPENFRAPQPIRTHPTEPFISIAPQTNEAMSIQPGEIYRMKYRFITFDGESDAEKIEALWQDYAHPVKAVWIE